ncbi:MAG TPA: ATP-binding cassette domain-containing protein [Gemmataceae bacterium]|jgi:ABC-2 type transport system ATP-binding protein|nr:ATP-binding cassette domain-containing protein [Gemmataceae bacterium]
MPSVLEISGIRKQFGAVEALRGVTLSVNEGEIFGLLGPNGAGKTTLLSILSGLLEPSSGSAQLLGRPLRRFDFELKRSIGIATQDVSLYGELTARENLEFFGRLYGMRGPELGKRVSEILEFTALADRANDRVGTFSGGMRRRLNLGAAVVHRPRILYLDEPTTGVDPQSRNHIFEEVRSLNAAGVTVIYTSHYMEEVQSLCPRIAIMDRGQVIASDTREGLLRLLDGTLTVQVAGDPGRLAEAIGRIDGAKVVKRDGNTLTVAAPDVRQLTLHIVSLLRELGQELTGLESNEPTLEKVFLHLTDTKVRD